MSNLTPAETIAAIVRNLGFLTWDCGQPVVDAAITEAFQGLIKVHTNLLDEARPSRSTGPADTIDALAALINDMRQHPILEIRTGPHVDCLRAIRAGLLAAAKDAPAQPATGPTWRRLALINPDGKLLWRGSPPSGTWQAEGPFEALDWESESHYRDWLYLQSQGLQDRLAREGWKLVELVTIARPLVLSSGYMHAEPVPAEAGVALEAALAAGGGI